MWLDAYNISSQALEPQTLKTQSVILADVPLPFSSESRCQKNMSPWLKPGIYAFKKIIESSFKYWAFDRISQIIKHIGQNDEIENPIGLPGSGITQHQLDAYPIQCFLGSSQGICREVNCRKMIAKRFQHQYDVAFGATDFQTAPVSMSGDDALHIFETVLLIR